MFKLNKPLVVNISNRIMLQHSKEASYSIISSHKFAEVREDASFLAKSLYSIQRFEKDGFV